MIRERQGYARDGVDLGLDLELEREVLLEVEEAGLGNWEGGVEGEVKLDAGEMRMGLWLGRREREGEGTKERRNYGGECRGGREKRSK